MYRAERLLVRRVLYGMRPAEAWRFVNPNSKSNDNSAAELTRREIQWYEQNRDSLSQRFGRFAGVPASSPEPFQARSEDGWFRRADDEVRRPCGQTLPEEDAPTAEALRKHARRRTGDDRSRATTSATFRPTERR